MRANRRTVLSLLACIVAMLSAWNAAISSTKRMKPMSREDIAQVWVGLSEDELSLFRFVLELDGTARAGYVFVDQEPKVLGVRSWTYDGRALAFSLDDQTANNIRSLKGTAVGGAIELTEEGAGWRTRISLRPERELERRWNRLREKMADAGNG